MTIFFESCEFGRATCSECGIVFFVPGQYQAKRREDHKTFWCPNGHTQYYPGESEKERYKRLYEQEKQCCQAANKRLEAEEDENRKLHFKVLSHRGVAARLRKKLDQPEQMAVK